MGTEAGTMTRVVRGERVIEFGPGLPTVIIGERINPTGRKRFGEELLKGSFDMVRSEAEKQAAAGADILDVNVGVGGIDEVAALKEAVRVAMAAVDLPLSIDSSNPDALAAALAVYDGKAIVNSVTAEEASMNEVLPVVAQYGAAVIALPHDEQGIPKTPKERIQHAERIIDRAAALCIPKEDVIVDALTIAVGADATAGVVTLETLRRLRDDLGVSTTIGASNVSFGLPDRRMINLTFLAMAIQNGVSAPITDPLVPGLRRLCRAADLVLGHDPRARRYVQDYRSHPE
jgi:5-methyltetrahydrofolate--homocysteine methyltransferase